ncbi:hypothetical protein QYF36_013934 [Acer negundo]|nr:hypothetical protein QYF36_013934 [Acer negundo]
MRWSMFTVSDEKVALGILENLEATKALEKGMPLERLAVEVAVAIPVKAAVSFGSISSKKERMGSGSTSKHMMKTRNSKRGGLNVLAKEIRVLLFVGFVWVVPAVCFCCLGSFARVVALFGAFRLPSLAFVCAVRGGLCALA